jgi:para-aminobenzoate synthetase component I
MTTDTLDGILSQVLPRVSEVRSETICLQKPFIEIVRRFAQSPGTVGLMSGGTSDCARYHILGLEPWLTLRGGVSSLEVDCLGTTTAVAQEPLGVLQHVLRRYEMRPSQQLLPISAGLLGYLSYDLKDCLEELPRTSVDDLRLPHLYMTAPSILLVEDRLEQRTSVHLPVFDGKTDDVSLRLARFREALSRPRSSGADRTVQGGGIKSGFSREGYMSAVEAIRDYIVRGHVYQVNMSQRFQSTFEGDAFELFVRLFARNPAAFFAFINAGDHQIVSTSPERFVRQNGRGVETRPIKGTRPRGKTADEDSRMRRDLVSSRKDDAELSMIVDLLRNDIGKVCCANSVHVSEHKRVEAYENVFHLVSIVEGLLDADKDAVDLIRATFPGGSITGCPKIRSMEIIDELEPVRRHIYTGSIGYISFHETMDLSIAIRTATIARGKVVFSVGGGIVYDSNPADEFEETLHKGRTLMNALEPAMSEDAGLDPVAWHNGVFVPRSQVMVSAEDEGFLYGYGIFETIRVERGIPFMLDDHVDRFNRAWLYCFGSPPPDISWRDVIREVVTRCGLVKQTAVAKILAAAGAPGQSVVGGTLLVTAREYVPRPAAVAGTGLHLVVYPQRRHLHLSDHKTMNYMFYKMAGHWAKRQKADEALILNHDSSVSETNSANLLCVSAGKIYRPQSEHVLPGTMEGAVCSLLTAWGRQVESRRLSVEELKAADQVFLTNSLMGAVPVTRIDDTPMPGDELDLCRRLNETLLERMSVA